MEGEPHPVRARFDISWQTIFKLLLGVLLAYVAIKLWPLFKLLAIAMLLAVPLYQIVRWATRKGWPRWVGLLLATTALVFCLAALVGLIGPMAFRQASALGKELPRIKEQVASQLPRSGPVADMLQTAFNSGSSNNSQEWLQRGLGAIKSTLGGMFDFALVLVLAIYFMVDGPRTLEWLIAFFPNRNRANVAKGLEEIGARIVAYVGGQFLLSCLFGGYAFIVLSILHVPMALLLGLLAGVFDVLPMIGIFLAVVPAMLMALTVSPQTALIVLGCYVAYHVFEDYFILPKVYGNKLKLSTLAVLLGFVVGGMLAGIVGAVMVLPLIAAYPVLERLWLGTALEPEVLEEHANLRAA